MQTEIEVKGLKVVLPKDNKVASFDANRGALTRHIKVYRLQEVVLPGVSHACP